MAIEMKKNRKLQLSFLRILKQFKKLEFLREGSSDFFVWNKCSLPKARRERRQTFRGKANTAKKPTLKVV